MKLVSEQVQILLERMDMHPGEFVKSYDYGVHNGKWYDILHGGTFNIIERTLIKRKYKKLKRKATQKDIMTTIMHGGDQEDDTLGPAMSTISRFTAIQRFNN